MQKKFGEKGREASPFSRSSPRWSRPRWREGARGAVLEHRSEGEERRGSRPGLRARSASASSAASATPTLPLKNGLARLSPATTPGRGAQLPSTADVCGGALARAVARPFSDRAARAPHDHGGVGLTC